MILPGEIRRRAWEMLEKSLGMSMIVTLLASLPALVFQAALSLSQQSLINAVLQYQYADLSGALLRRIVLAASQSMGGLARGLWLSVPVLFIMLPFLNIGRMYFHLRVLRGVQAGVQDVFSRASCFIKAIVLEILTVIKVVLWTLPGFAVMLGGALLYVQVRGVSEGVFTFIYSLGMGAMLFLGVRANLHYLMAPVIMADVPEKGPVVCLKESIGMMRKKVFPLFSLLVSFVLYMLLEDIVVNLIAAISYPVGLVINLALSLVLTAWMNTALCGYYEVRRGAEQKTFEEEPTELN